MKKFKVEFEMPDTFEPGDCTFCPMHGESYDDEDGSTTWCNIEDEVNSGCPLKEVKKKVISKKEICRYKGHMVNQGLWWCDKVAADGTQVHPDCDCQNCSDYEELTISVI